MSQHRYRFKKDGAEVEVLMGWDRPLQHVFMVVEDLSDESGDYLYSNLYEPNMSALTLEYFRGVLDRLQIQVPESMFQEVEIDRRNNAGNRFVVHSENGEFVSRG